MAQNYPFYTPIDEALFDSRLIQISGQVNSQMAYEVNRTILAMSRKDSKKPIVLWINSPGGEINSGFSIYDTARFIDVDVYTVVAGLAASMGSLIALAAPKQRRYCLPNAKFLIHQPLISGTIYGPASDIEIHAKDIIQTRERINQLYVQETGQPMDVVTKATDRDYWMDTAQALEFGLISKVIKSSKELPLG
jgi:ATP-dependent Clp protease protease subunit